MNPSEVYQTLMSCARVLRECAEDVNRDVFRDEFCVVFVASGKSVVVGKDGEVFIQGLGREIRWGGGVKLRNSEEVLDTGEGAGAIPPNAYGARWTRGQKQELELGNTLETLLKSLYN